MNSRQQSKYRMIQNVLYYLENNSTLKGEITNLEEPILAMRKLLYEIGETESYYMTQNSLLPYDKQRQQLRILRKKRRVLFRHCRVIITQLFDYEINKIRNLFPVQYFTYTLYRRVNNPSLPLAGRYKWDMKTPKFEFYTHPNGTTYSNLVAS